MEILFTVFNGAATLVLFAALIISVNHFRKRFGGVEKRNKNQIKEHLLALELRIERLTREEAVKRKQLEERVKLLESKLSRIYQQKETKK